MDSAGATRLPSPEQFYALNSQVGTKDKNVTWYYKDFSGTPQDARTLLEGYAGISPNMVDAHVLAVRDKAWEVYPYPGIGRFRFLTLRLHNKLSYAKMLDNLKAGAKYLEIGCCLGQDIRKLVADGVPSENLYGIDLETGFIELGYELFQDKHKLKAQFMQSDALNITVGSALQGLRGTFDYIHLGMILHLLERSEQQLLFENCIQLLKPEAQTFILGTAVGDVEGVQTPPGPFLHSDETFRKMWDDLCKEKGLHVNCNAVLNEDLLNLEAGSKWDYNRSRRLDFEVKISPQQQA